MRWPRRSWTRAIQRRPPSTWRSAGVPVRPMNAQPDYFSNHKLKLRFPWRLYHGPIIESLQRVVSLSPGADVLNLGSGPFFELKELQKSDRRFTVSDIDPRAVELAKEIYGDTLAGAD